MPILDTPCSVQPDNMPELPFFGLLPSSLSSLLRRRPSLGCALVNTNNTNPESAPSTTPLIGFSHSEALYTHPNNPRSMYQTTRDCHHDPEPVKLFKLANSKPSYSI